MILYIFLVRIQKKRQYDPINLYPGLIDSVDSTKIMPFKNLPLCYRNPLKEPQVPEESIFQKNKITRYYDYGFQILFNVDVDKHNLCYRGFTEEEVHLFQSAINASSWYNMMFDTIPIKIDIGTTGSGVPFLFTHWIFDIIHNGYSILNIKVRSVNPQALLPNSIYNFSYSAFWDFDNESTSESIYSMNPGSFSYTNFHDSYRLSSHIYSIEYTGIFVLIILFFTIYFLFSLLSEDFIAFSKESTFDDFENSTFLDHSWKTLFGDIFRIPKNSIYIFILVSISSHFLFLFFILIIFIFFLMKSSKFSSDIIISLSIILYITTTPLSGYIFNSLYSNYQKRSNISLSFIPGLIFPIILFIFQLPIFSFSLISQQKCFLMILICPIFSFLGGLISYKIPLFNKTRTVSLIQRVEQKPPFLFRIPSLSFLIGFINSYPFLKELNWILIGIGLNDFKGVFIDCVINFFFTFILSICITCVVTYYRLILEIHHWQWESFLFNSFSFVFIFIYFLIYMFINMEFSKKNDYISYIVITFIISLVFGLLCGGSGYLSANTLIRVIFANLKIE